MDYGIAPGQVASHPSQTLLAKTRWESSFEAEIHIAGSFGVGDIGACDLWIVKDGTEILLFAEEAGSMVSIDLNVSVNHGTSIDFVHGLGDSWGSENVPLNIMITPTTELNCLNFGVVSIYDLNQDCSINLWDFAAFAQYWLQTPMP